VPGRGGNNFFSILNELDFNGIAGRIRHITDFQVDSKRQLFAEKIVLRALGAVIQLPAGFDGNLRERRLNSCKRNEFFHPQARDYVPVFRGKLRSQSSLPSPKKVGITNCA
jgi:hypothetical protein